MVTIEKEKAASALNAYGQLLASESGIFEKTPPPRLLLKLGPKEMLSWVHIITRVQELGYEIPTAVEFHFLAAVFAAAKFELNPTAATAKAMSTTWKQLLSEIRASKNTGSSKSVSNIFEDL